MYKTVYQGRPPDVAYANSIRVAQVRASSLLLVRSVCVWGVEKQHQEPSCLEEHNDGEYCSPQSSSRDASANGTCGCDERAWQPEPHSARRQVAQGNTSPSATDARSASPGQRRTRTFQNSNKAWQATSGGSQ